MRLRPALPAYVKINGRWRYVYRAIDQHGQIIDVLVSKRRNAGAARRLFGRALTTLEVIPIEVITDAPASFGPTPKLYVDHSP